MRWRLDRTGAGYGADMLTTTEGGDVHAARRARLELAEREYEEEVAMHRRARREGGRTRMIVGALAFLVGLGGTLLSISASAGGGRYVVFYGALVFGPIHFLRGLYTYCRP